LLGRVWIDILTPKQILFFAPLVEELESLGLEVLATSRRYRELAPIARWQGLKLVFVGERGGSSKAEQLAAATRREAEMIPMVDRFGPDASLSVASGVCARVSFGLGTKHIAVNDSPHSEIANRLSLPLSHHLFCPWLVPYGAWARFGVPRSKVTRYHALDPAAWLKRPARRGHVPRLSGKRKTVVVRLEESYAPYMAGTKRSWNDTILHSVGSSFPDANLVALCRYGDQLRKTKQEFGDRFTVPEEVVDGRSLLEVTDVFVGLGGTMTTESALMGVPTISAFQGSLWTEAYLTRVGLLHRARSHRQVVRIAERLLRGDRRARFARKARRILHSMEDPIPKIAGYVVENSRQA
jgi:predicted glycosyltransferase